MPRPPKSAAASSRLIPRLVRYVRERGGDADGLARRFGLPRDVESLAEAPVAPEDFEPLMDAASIELDDPCLAVHLAESLEWPSYSIPELAARACPTLREAFERVARYGALFYAHLALACEERDGELLFTHRVRGARGVGLRHSNEYALASALQHARRLVTMDPHAARRIAPSRVWFAHARPRGAEGLQAFFDTARIDFDRPDSGLAFTEATGALPTRTDDARLLATAEALAERALRESPPAADFTATVASRLRRELARGDVQAATIARQMKLSPRTLQRRLEAEGTGFKELLETVRRELAEDWVRREALPLTEIAYRLGYSDAAAFSRAFKRWTGSSPAVYRASSASNEPS